MSLEESRNPLAKGLLSIFNLVIWEHRKEQRYMDTALGYCRVQSVNQSIPCDFTANFILAPCACVLLLRHSKAEEANQGALQVWQWKNQRARQAQPSCCLEQEEPTHRQHSSFQILFQHQSGCLSQAVQTTLLTAEPAWWSWASTRTSPSDLKPQLHFTTTFYFTGMEMFSARPTSHHIGAV